MNTDCKNAAHRYVSEFTWAVIPLHHVITFDGHAACSCRQGPRCESAGKHPRTGAWTRRGATSGADVEAFWEEYPDANVGILTGSPSGVWVLDVDLDKPGGPESWARLKAEHVWQPGGREHRTGGGGFHRFFTLPDGVVVPSRPLPGYPGIDVRGEGGMVVAPPSLSGKGYYTGPDE